MIPLPLSLAKRASLLRLVRHSWWFPAVVMTGVLLAFGVPAGLLAPPDATVAGEVVEVCAASDDRGHVRVSTVMDTTVCATPAGNRAADEGSILLSFMSSDEGLRVGRGAEVRVDLAYRSVALVSAARSEGTLVLARWVVVFVEVPLDALPPRPFVIRDAAGDAVVGVEQPS